MFKGSYTALITPFRNGKVDETAFERFVEWQIAQGTHGLVPVGTTGECPTVSHAEHKRIVEICIAVAKKRVPVIAGAGSNSTAEAMDFAQHAKQAGADASKPASSVLSDVFLGKTGPRGGQRDGLAQTLAKSVVRTIGSSVGREIVRGMLGSILGKRR